MRLSTIILPVSLATLLFAPPASSAAIINFERINGTVPFEGMAISNQFQPYYGVSFRRAAGAGEPWPVIARIGSPRTAFDRSGTNDVDTVVAGSAAAIGEFFLTDNVDSGGGDHSLVLDFDAPVSQVGGYILDIDGNEDVRVSVYSDSTTTNALDSRVISSGSSGTGDGAATLWSFTRPTRDIRRVEIEPGGAPIGYDLFSSNYVPPPASAASLALKLYPGLSIQGDVGRPYRIDFADKIDQSDTATNWHALTNLFLPHSPYLFLDASPASSSERYYRAVAFP